jgi:hypothetical protein
LSKHLSPPSPSSAWASCGPGRSRRPRSVAMFGALRRV